MAGTGPEAYERHMVPAIFGPWAPLLLDLARLQPGERVLDAACGTGIVARLARARVGTTGKITGGDLNPGMLAVARTVSEIAQPPIDWRDGNLEALPFADSEFDVVLCLQGLQFTAKRNVAAAELHRVLRPGGRLVLSIWRDLEHCPYMVAITGALEDRLGVEASRRMAAPCSLGSAAELRALLSNAGFQDIHIRIDVLPMRIPDLDEFLPGQFVASPLAADIAALGERARTALFDDIAHRLLPHMDEGGLAAPFEAHSISARR
jgi:SAM-dependent methyltransferase